MDRLQGKKAIITGARRGIGRATALRFAAEGADLVLTDLDAADIEPVCEEVRSLGRVAVGMSWNLTDFAAAPAKLREARDALGGLDVVVNNAGVNRRSEGHPDQSPLSSWDFIMDANLKGLFFASEAAGALLTERGGAIVNVASDAALRGAATDYAISKWGVAGYTRGLAKKLAPRGVRVNAVAPGPVATQMMGSEDGVPETRGEQPLGRFSYPEEVADVILFLASPDARAVFGQVVGVNTKEF